MKNSVMNNNKIAEDECSGLATVIVENPVHCYLKEVKDVFNESSNEYKEFLEMLIDYMAKRLDIQSFKARVKEIFKGHRDLLVGFNIFLPKDHKISQLPPENDMIHADGWNWIPELAVDDISKFVAKLQSRDPSVSMNKPPDVVNHEIAALVCNHPDLQLEIVPGCEPCTPSYRFNPKDELVPLALCRRANDKLVLNDSLVAGSKDRSFKHMLKYECSLLRCEDDRFEMDMLLETVSANILMNKIDQESIPKSLDYRSSTYFKRNMESLSTKALLAEIKKSLGLKRKVLSLTDGKEEHTVIHQVDFEYPTDPDFHYDIYQLLIRYKPEVLDKVLTIWMDFLEPMLCVPPLQDASDNAKNVLHALNRLSDNINRSASESKYCDGDWNGAGNDRITDDGQHVSRIFSGNGLFYILSRIYERLRKASTANNWNWRISHASQWCISQLSLGNPTADISLRSFSEEDTVGTTIVGIKTSKFVVIAAEGRVSDVNGAILTDEEVKILWIIDEVYATASGHSHDILHVIASLRAYYAIVKNRPDSVAAVASRLVIISDCRMRFNFIICGCLSNSSDLGLYMIRKRSIDPAYRVDPVNMVARSGGRSMHGHSCPV